MASPLTEAYHAQAEGLDTRSDDQILLCLLHGQQQALEALSTALPDLARASGLMAQAIESGGRLVYAAAGSSGLMALADAAELGGTYGIPQDRVRILMAGGLPTGADMPGATEDDISSAERDADILTANDTLIAVSASGTTPYPMTIARIAQDRGARVVCIANNAGAKMFDHADVEVCLPTPPEIIAGSTRMGAGTAQKAALNLMSTLMGIRLGHVYDGMMINLVADNAKLHIRATTMIEKIVGVDEATASKCLTQTNGSVKPAVLLAAGVGSTDQAETLMTETNGNLRAALARL